LLETTKKTMGKINKKRHFHPDLTLWWVKDIYYALSGKNRKENAVCQL